VDYEQIDEDWKKVSENQAVTFTDFTDYDSSVIKTALLIVEDVQCSKCRQGHGRGEQ
jgi:hypothetical protein